MTPDATVRWYYRMRDSFGAPAMNFVDSTGRMYAETCADCGYKIRHCRDDTVWVCGRCGLTWGYVDRHIFKGEVQKSIRTDTFERVNARWIDVGTQIHYFLEDPLWKWDARIYILNALGFSMRQIAADGPKMFPAVKGSWDKMIVCRRIVAARGEFFGRLKNAGILCS
jgi:hypothetical protein